MPGSIEIEIAIKPVIKIVFIFPSFVDEPVDSRQLKFEFVSNGSADDAGSSLKQCGIQAVPTMSSRTTLGHLMCLAV
jgi:hypothetical protein